MRCASMRCMRKAMKPVIVIVLAVAVAAGAAVFLSRQPDRPSETNAAPLTADIKSGGHFRGPENAQVTLVEFGDYQCPSCGAYHPLLKEMSQGDTAKIQAVPTYFINGQQVHILLSMESFVWDIEANLYK